MIATDFDISDPLNWLLIALLAMLLATQLWIILKNDALTQRRRAVKLALNLFLWLVAFAFLVQPRWKVASSPRKLIIAGKGVPDSWLVHLKDSLRADGIQSQDDLDEKSNPAIVLAGQDFKPEFYSRLLRSGRRALMWAPYGHVDRLMNATWEGVLRKGQMQHVRGSLYASKNQFLKIQYAGNTLDSVSLKAGLNSFELKFPVFVQGNVLTRLTLDGKPLDDVQFFARPAQSRRFGFVLDSPDFETRTLANWLGRNGQSVSVISKLSKNVTSSQTINKSGEPDIYITDPANSNHPVIKKALASGKSILFIGLSDVEKDFLMVNSALGSNLNVTRTTSDDKVILSEGLTALPYRFVSSARTHNMPNLPVAITKAKGRIGVSLLNETFPLMLSADTLRYSKIWTEILAKIAPPDSANVQIAAPLFDGMVSQININNVAPAQPVINFAGYQKKLDTVFTQSSLLNDHTSYAKIVPTGAGEWKEMKGAFKETRFFVEPENAHTSVRQFKYLQNLMKQYERAGTEASESAVTSLQLPGYVWFLLFTISFTALWAEAKFALPA